MKKIMIIHFISALSFILLICVGCQLYSMIIFENPDYKKSLLSQDVDPKILEKYRTNSVLVRPDIVYTDGFQNEFKLIVVFYSKTKSPNVSVEEAIVTVGEKEIEYGEVLRNQKATEWSQFPEKKYYYCGIGGDLGVEPIGCPKKEMVKGRVDVSVVVSVEHRGKKTNKRIDTYFLPKTVYFME